MKDDKKVGIQFGEEVAGRTIVGGRGTARKSGRVSVPVGIEKILYLAATDTEFRERLEHDREGVVSDPRLGLRGDEAAILRGVSAQQLAVMIDNIDPTKHGRRRFIQSVAACAASLAAGTVVVSCGDDVDTVTRGATGGTIDSDVDISHGMDAGGDRPDVPESLPDASEVPDAAADASTDVAQCCDAAGTDSGIPDDGDFDAPDADTPDHVEVEVDGSGSFGILPDTGDPDAADSGSPDRVEIDLDANQPAGILPDGGDE